MPESKWPMVPVEDALAVIQRHAAPLAPVDLPLSAALGHVLAEDVRATEDMPPFPASTVDGFAVVAADTVPLRRLVGEQIAGHMADVLVTPGTAARITTGAPVPSGADAVVMVERTEERDGVVTVHETGLGPGNNIRPVGVDIQRGELVLRRGQTLGPAELGVLATLGLPSARAIRQPVVAILSTGDELVEPGQTPGPGQIRDSNRYTLMAAVRQLGAVPLDLGIAQDEPGDLEARVRRGLSEGDVFISSGGVSMGHRDLVKPLLEELGHVHFGRVTMRPGKPLTFATVGQTLAFALPGNPVSSIVCFEVFVRPALRLLQGRVPEERPHVRARLAHAVESEAERTDYQRARVRREGGVYVAQTTGFQGSSRLMSMVGANALLVLPRGIGHAPAGAEVDAMLLEPVRES